jgi:hypothetical protein
MPNEADSAGRSGAIRHWEFGFLWSFVIPECRKTLAFLLKKINPTMVQCFRFNVHD